MQGQMDAKRSGIEMAVEDVLRRVGEPFVAQKKVGPWFVDFYLPRRNLVLECDGRYWHSLPRMVSRDKIRDGWMKKHGYPVARLAEGEINTDPRAAVARVLAEHPRQEAA